jgi:O-antigen/teichoic acid export membrane protein
MLISRLNSLRWLLQFHAFDTSTEEGRSKERYRRLAWNTATSLAARLVSMLTVFATARLALNYLGNERYGLWMTLSSIVTLLGFADLGVGNGLLNEVSHAHGRRDHVAMRAAISSSLLILGLVGLGLLALLTFGYGFLPWDRLFNVKSVLSRSEAGPASAVFLACFALNLPLGTISRVYTGLQEAFVANLWQMGGNLLALAAVLTAVLTKAGLPWLVLALAAPPLLMLGVAGSFLFFRHRPWLKPSLTLASGPSARRLLGRGVFFLGFSVLSPLAFYSDNLIVAHLVSAEAVAGYAVTAKLFGLCTLLAGMVTGALWPAYAEANARQDYAWIQKALLRTLSWGSLTVCLPAAILCFIAPWVLRLWLGQALHPDMILLIGLALWALMSHVGFTVGNFLWSLNLLKYDLTISVGMTALALALKLGLTWKYGVPGVVWGLVIAYFLSCLPHLWFIPRLFKRLQAGKPMQEDVVWIS